MNQLNGLPACPIWTIETELLKMGLGVHCMEGREDGSQLALVSENESGIWQNKERRAIASMTSTEEKPAVVWVNTQAEAIAAFSAALRRLGWEGAPTLCDNVYGDAS